jgi:hypothetical protein
MDVIRSTLAKLLCDRIVSLGDRFIINFFIYLFQLPLTERKNKFLLLLGSQDVPVYSCH